VIRSSLPSRPDQNPDPTVQLRRASRKTADSPGVEFALPGRHLTQSKPIRSRSPFGYMTQLTPGGNFDASPSQSSPTERTRPVACSPWRKLLVYSVCGTLLARLGRDCSRGSTTMFSSFADLAFSKQNCSLPKSRCAPRTRGDTATDWTAATRPRSPDPTERSFVEASIKNACFHKHLVSRILEFKSADAISMLKGGARPPNIKPSGTGCLCRAGGKRVAGRAPPAHTHSSK
jgi:hypothetical protein